MTRFAAPKTYSIEELEKIAETARELFRQNRQQEEKAWAAFYSQAFSETFIRAERVFEASNNLTRFDEVGRDLLQDGYLDILRYMDRPTVSSDDFESLSEANTSSSRRLADERLSSLAMTFLERNLNDDLFPWLKNGTDPTAADMLAAKRAVAALVAEQRTKTAMRNKASETQEHAVKKELVTSCGLANVEGHDFDTLRDAPEAGKLFARETKVAGTKADIVFGLADGRFMALECKVSNSAVNSYKRLNHEAVEKIKRWNAAFGSNGVVGGVVLQGIFKPNDLAAAQDDGAFLFWSHDMAPLVEFVSSLGEAW